MTTTWSIVPRLSRADLLAIEHWNARQEAARKAYRDEPLALAVSGSGDCSVCRQRRHHKCSSETYHGGVRTICRCFAYDHRPRDV